MYIDVEALGDADRVVEPLSELDGITATSLPSALPLQPPFNIKARLPIRGCVDPIDFKGVFYARDALQIVWGQAAASVVSHRNCM